MAVQLQCNKDMAVAERSVEQGEKLVARQEVTLPEAVALHEFPAPGLELAWREMLTRVALPSHYTSPEWFREPYFEGKRPFAILVLQSGRAVAVVTGFHEGEEVRCGLPTRPQVQIVEEEMSSESWTVLREALEKEAGKAALVSVYSWEWMPLAGLEKFGYRRKVVQEIPMLDLTLGAETLLKQCDKKRRNSIRYAIKNGVEVAEGEKDEELRAFHDIYEGWCRSKQTHCYPYAVEQRAFRETRGNRKIFLARHSGKIIAGSVFRFFPGGLVDYSRNGSLPEHQGLKPNDILAWRAVEWACENGFLRMSMGGSHRFLREFGGAAVPVQRYRLDRSLLRRHDRREEMVESAGKLVKRLPPQWETRVRKILRKEKPAGW
jgi:hypothetical protein